MDAGTLVHHVRAGTGASPREARRAARATLAALALGLDEPLRRTLGQEVDGLLIDGDRPGEARELDAITLQAEVRRRARTTLAKAVEVTEVVLRALGEGLSEELLVRLRNQVDPSIAALLAPAEPAPEDPPHLRRHPPFARVRGLTLSTGRPGFAEPLAEAHGSIAHSGSVVTPNPHGDTKVSSAHGTTEEQDDRTLAETTGPRLSHGPRPRSGA